MKRLLEAAESVCSISAILCLAAMSAVNIIQIFLRYLFNIAFVWVFPVTMLLFIWMTFLGAFVVYHRKKDIIVTFIVNLLPANLRKAVEILSILLVLFLIAIVLAQGPSLIRQQSSTMQIIPLPRYVQTLPLLIGLVGIFVDSVMDLVSAFSRLRNPLRDLGGGIS